MACRPRGIEGTGHGHPTGFPHCRKAIGWWGSRTLCGRVRPGVQHRVEIDSLLWCGLKVFLPRDTRGNCYTSVKFTLRGALQLALMPKTTDQRSHLAPDFLLELMRDRRRQAA